MPMGTFGKSGRKVLEFMSIGTEFDFEEKRYRMLKQGRSICKNGESKQIFIYDNLNDVFKMTGNTVLVNLAYEIACSIKQVLANYAR